MIEKVILTISEPWDFNSSDGDNILSCIVIRKIQVELFDVLICKCTSEFKLGIDKIEFVGLSKRGEDSDQFNIYKILNMDSLDDEVTVFKKENFKHVMIGKRQT